MQAPVGGGSGALACRGRSALAAKAICLPRKARVRMTLSTPVGKRTDVLSRWLGAA